jgi:hypothetical protein
MRSGFLAAARGAGARLDKRATTRKETANVAARRRSKSLMNANRKHAR